MNYKKKIQEIELEINMINKYYINQIKEPDDKITKRLNILREEHYFLLEKICLSIILLFSILFLVFILYLIFH